MRSYTKSSNYQPPLFLCRQHQHSEKFFLPGRHGAMFNTASCDFVVFKVASCAFLFFLFFFLLLLQNNQRQRYSVIPATVLIWIYPAYTRDSCFIVYLSIQHFQQQHFAVCCGQWWSETLLFFNLWARTPLRTHIFLLFLFMKQALHNTKSDSPPHISANDILPQNPL